MSKNFESAGFYSLVVFAIIGAGLAIADPFDISMTYAESIPRDPYVLQDPMNDYYFEYGQLIKSVHGTQERLLDYYDEKGNPVYVSSKMYETPTSINYESAQNSYAIMKSDGAVLVYDGGHISGTPKKVLTHVMKSATNGTDIWNDETVNSESYQINNLGNRVILTKSNFDDMTNTGSEFDVIYDFDDFGFLEWTYKTTNRDVTKTDQKYGFTFTCDGAGCDDMEINGVPIADGQVKTKHEIMGKGLKIGKQKFDTKEETHGATWALKKENGKTIVDFTHAKNRLAVGDTLEIDPVLVTPAGQEFEVRTGAPPASSSCSWTGVTKNFDVGNSRTYLETSGSTSNYCSVGGVKFDVSGLVSPGAITSAVWDGSIGTVTNARNCDIMEVLLDPATASASDLMTDMRDGAVFLDNDTWCTSTGAFSVSLNSNAYASFINSISGGADFVAISYPYDDETRNGSSHDLDSFTSQTLTLTYDTADTPGKPTGLSSSSEPYVVNGTWTGCESDGYSDNSCSLISGVSLWNATAVKYAGVALPDNAGTDTEYPTVDGSIDFGDNEILYHFEEQSSNLESPDSSGSNSNATVFMPSSFNPEIDDDLTSSSGWTNSGSIETYDGTNDEWDFQSTLTSDVSYVYADPMGAPLSDEFYLSATIRFDTLSTTDTCGSSIHNIGVSTLSTTMGSNIVQDFIGMGWWNDDFEVQDKDNAMIIPAYDTGFDLPTGTYYLKMIRDGTVFTLQLDDNSDFSSPELESIDNSVTGSGFRYLHLSTHHANSGICSVASSTWSVDDIVYIDGETSLIDDELSFSGGLIDGATNKFPLNFTSTDSLFETTSNSQVGGFVRLNSSENFNMFSFNDTSDNVVEIGLNETKQYVRYNRADLASVDNDCNLFSWCFYSLDRNGNTFSFYQNGTMKGTGASSQNFGTAKNDSFFIGYNNTVISTTLVASLDEYYVNDGTDTTDVLRIGERGLNDPVWLSNMSNQTYAECPGGISDDISCRVRLVSIAGNGTLSDLIYGITDGLPDPPSLSANATSENDIDIVRSAGAGDGGDAVTHWDLRYELNGSGGWNSLLTNSTSLSFHNHTGLSSGDILIYQGRDRNGVGYSEWSGNSTAQTYRDIEGSLTVDLDQVGDVFNATGTLTVSNSSPLPVTISLLELISNGTVVTTSVPSDSFVLETKNISPIWYEVGDDDLRTFTLNATITNGVDTLEIASSNSKNGTREYVPTMFPGVDTPSQTLNYTIVRDESALTLKMNRAINGTWQAECLTRDLAEALADSGGTWDNKTDIGYYKNTDGAVPITKTVYISCYNDDLLFTTTSYSNSTNSLVEGLNIFDDLGGLFGAPAVMLIILAVATMATGRTAPTVLVILLTVIGIVGALGMLVLEAEVWGLLVVAGAIGIFQVRRLF